MKADLGVAVGGTMQLETRQYVENSRRLGRLSETAKYMYKHGLFPKGKSEEMLDIIAKLDSMTEKWF